MKGGYQAGSPSLHGGNEMLHGMEGGVACVGITLKREKCRKMSVSSETAHVKEEGGQYRVYSQEKSIVWKDRKVNRRKNKKRKSNCSGRNELILKM